MCPTRAPSHQADRSVSAELRPQRKTSKERERYEAVWFSSLHLFSCFRSQFVDECGEGFDLVVFQFEVRQLRRFDARVGKEPFEVVLREPFPREIKFGIRDPLRIHFDMPMTTAASLAPEETQSTCRRRKRSRSRRPRRNDFQSRQRDIAVVETARDRDGPFPLLRQRQSCRIFATACGGRDISFGCDLLILSSLLPELRHHFLPGIEHLRIERQNTVSRDLRRRRQQLRQTVVNHSARLRIHARKQMPQGQSVAHVRLTDHDLKLPETLARVVNRIDSRTRCLKFSRRVFKIRCAWACALPGSAKRAGRNDRLRTITFQRDEAQRDMKQTASVLLNLEYVLTSKIDSARRRRIHDKQSGRRPCLRFDFSAIQCDTMLIRLSRQKSNTRVRNDDKAAESRYFDLCRGSCIRFQSFAYVKMRHATQPGHFP